MLKTRILTGFVLAVVVAAAVLLLDTAQASVVFAVFWLIGAIEWGGLSALPKAGRAAYAAVFAVLVAVVLTANPPVWAISVWLWLAVACWLVALYYVLLYPRSLTNLLIVPAGIVVLTAAWVSFYLLHGSGDSGPALILAGLGIVWSADVGAYFVGRTFGRTRLAPRVSPNKTWEGVAGGAAAAILVGAITALVIGLPFGLLIPLSGAIALVSVVGDLGISMLKRRAGLKDTGVLLPGHGGILDRFDGVTAALPAYVLGLQFAHVLD